MSVTFGGRFDNSGVVRLAVAADRLFAGAGRMTLRIKPPDGISPVRTRSGLASVAGGRFQPGQRKRFEPVRFQH